MIYISKDKLIERILYTPDSKEADLAKKMYSILQWNSEFDEYEIVDFLENEEIFQIAKKEIYDILTTEHQRYFDIAERILWGNKKKEGNDDQPQAEPGEASENIHTRDLFIGLKKWAKGKSSIEDMGMTFLLYWGLAEHLIVEQIKEEIQAREGEVPTDEEIRNFIEETFSDEALQAHDPLTLSTLIINSLKRYSKGMGWQYLPEYLKRSKEDPGPHQDRLNTNMNTTAILMWIPFSQERLPQFSEASAEFMMRIESEWFGLFMCHFEIDSPEKMNKVMEDFATVAQAQSEQWTYKYFPFVTGKNALVEFLCDGFHKAEYLSEYLSYFQINTLEDFKNFFPYLTKLYHRNKDISWEMAMQIFEYFWIATIEQYLQVLESLQNFYEDENGLNYSKKTRLLWDHKDESVEAVCDFLGFSTKEERFNFLISEHFMLLIEMFQQTNWILTTYNLQLDEKLSKEENLKEIYNILNNKDRCQTTYEQVDGENRMEATLDYAYANQNLRIKEEKRQQLNQLFQPIETKDFIYTQIKEIYLHLLKGQENQLFYKQFATLQTLQSHGVGNMSATTQLVNRTNEFWKASKHSNMTPEIFTALQKNLTDLEERMKNRPLMEQADTYGNFNTLFKVSPQLTQTATSLATTLSQKETKAFSKEILPLVCSRMLLSQENANPNPRWDAERKYNPEKIQEIQDYLSSLLSKIQDHKQQISFPIIKQEILLAMAEYIKQQFWLKALPIEKIETDFSTIQHYLTYIANLDGQKNQDIQLLWLFFGLQINDLWTDFRAGKEVELNDIFEKKTLNKLFGYFYKRKEYPLLKSYDEATQRKLQEETISQYMGNITTIDTELSALQQDIQDLLDPDNFPNDHQLFQLLLEQGKEIWTVLALLFQQKELSTAQQALKQQLETMFGTLTKERITQLQTEIKQINPLITFVKKVEELEIPSLLVKLNQAKTPSTEIIAIFAKVGEKLSTDSGILPLPNDITYVKSLFQNIEHAILTVQEKEKALSYIAEIEKQVANLYQVKEKIQDFVRNLSNQISVTGNTLLTTKIAPLQQKLFMNTSTEKTSLITKMTNNFEVIIPNIRGCLGCMQKECNNPHNLAFWDPNKFFMAIYGNDEEKTIADAIVDIFPYQVKGEEKSDISTKKPLAFVVERVYGERTPDVLLSIIQTIKKKQEEAGVSDIAIFISDEALTSCYTNLHHLQEEFKEEDLKIENISLDIEKTPSPSGYGYYEFGNTWILLQSQAI